MPCDFDVIDGDNNSAVIPAVRINSNCAKEGALNNRVLVTGAGGFIGSHLVEALLSSGCPVRAMVHYNARNDWGWLREVLDNYSGQKHQQTELGVLYPELNRGGALEIVPGDIRDPYFVDTAVKGCGIVFHLAALIGIPYSYTAPASYISTNVQGTLHILEAGRKHGVSCIVHTSTSEVYGTARYTPIDEDHPLLGQSPYSASKIGADQLAVSYCRSFDVPVSIIRPFNTFGPRQSARAVIPTIITQVLSGNGTIRLGALEPVRDLTFVADTVAGFLSVAGADKTIGQVVNIGTGEGITIGDLARLILKLCRSTDRIELDPQRIRPVKSEVYELICCNHKAHEQTGWMPRHTLEEGLKKTIAWFKKNSHSYQASIYNL